VTKILDHMGRPIERKVLVQEVSAASVSGVRSPTTGYPADGLTPARLGSILKGADAGDPISYMELAETIEERDPHYLSVIGTRRRAVSQIEVTVEAASEAPADEAIAEEIRAWLTRDELTAELFHILDCIPKGYSATEIIWDTSMGQHQPARLELRDPRWFRFARHDLRTPLRLDDAGQEVPLEPGKFIWAQISAKSGLPLRSGLSRVAAWTYLFKKFTERDWAIFTQTYGHPLRVGKFQPGASEQDKRTLLRAVTNIAGDMAAIVPESMMIEFVEAANVGSSHQLYKERADWLDQQLSKAVLGQTGTTDALTGGLGSGKEHREVQEDLERSDARALAAVLNRDLIYPWVQLNHGPQKAYPRLRIARPEQEDLAQLSAALAPLIDRGLEVSHDAMLAKFGLPQAKAGAKLLRPQRAAPSGLPGDPPPDDRPQEGEEADDGRPDDRRDPALQSEERPGPRAPEDILADRLANEAAPAMEALVATVEAMLGRAGSLPEFREMLLAAFPDLSVDDLAAIIGMGLVAAHAGGRVAADEDAK
jgi:phage gp29-like protein